MGHGDTLLRYGGRMIESLSEFGSGEVEIG